ncbi:MAG: hypothetical protein NT088_02980 [Candidatus Omnitrophica bacterium]|nr:hypothetical protein [Candidatus Omnitrophota bacterium]
MTDSGKVDSVVEGFRKLADAVALKGKPVAEFDYIIYCEEKAMCDRILNDFKLETLDDSVHNQIWFFRTENRVDALRRISELNEIYNANRRITFADHKRIGELFGYAQADIEGFLSRRSFNIITEYATTGKVELRRTSNRLALMDKYNL